MAVCRGRDSFLVGSGLGGRRDLPGRAEARWRDPAKYNYYNVYGVDVFAAYALRAVERSQIGRNLWKNGGNSMCVCNASVGGLDGAGEDFCVCTSGRDFLLGTNGVVGGSTAAGCI